MFFISFQREYHILRLSKKISLPKLKIFWLDSKTSRKELSIWQIQVSTLKPTRLDHSLMSYRSKAADNKNKIAVPQ